jgi:peptidyl-prolyl cis-trans isomerase C
MKQNKNAVKKPQFKLLISIIAAAVFIIPSCKMSGDVLAEFGEGRITRGDFYEWIEMKGMNKESLLKKKNQQKNRIKQMALEQLAIAEAKKAGFDKDEKLLYMAESMKRRSTANFYEKKIREDGVFSEEAVNLRQIKFIIKNYKVENQKRVDLTPKELEEESAKKMESALNVLKELNAGGKFEELAQKYSEDFTKKNGGLAGFITRDMREPEFSEKVFSMKEGDVSKEPFKTGNAVYIVKIEEKTNLTNKNIDKLIDDKSQAKMMRSRLSGKGITAFHKQLKDEGGYEFKPENIKSADKSAVIFSIDGKKFTAADLKSYIEQNYDKNHHMKTNPINDEMKTRIVDRLLIEELITRKAVKDQIDKDEKYIKQWQNFYNSMLASEYKKNTLLTDIQVTDAEVRDEYEKNKTRSYTKREKKGTNVVQVQIPFNEVKDNIKQMLINKKRTLKVRGWEENLLNTAGFTIHENKLEGE